MKTGADRNETPFILYIPQKIFFFWGVYRNQLVRLSVSLLKKFTKKKYEGVGVLVKHC